MFCSKKSLEWANQCIRLGPFPSTWMWGEGDHLTTKVEVVCAGAYTSQNETSQNLPASQR